MVVDQPEDYRPIPGAAVARLCAHGFRCPVVTIQSRIAKGVFTEAAFLSWFRGLADAFEAEAAVLEGPYVCPHRFATPCPCKKPHTLLYERAAADHGLDLVGAFVVGDSGADMEAARRIGGRGCLVPTGWGQMANDRARARPLAAPAHVAASLSGAVDWILSQSPI